MTRSGLTVISRPFGKYLRVPNTFVEGCMCGGLQDLVEVFLGGVWMHHFKFISGLLHSSIPSSTCSKSCCKTHCFSLDQLLKYKIYLPHISRGGNSILIQGGDFYIKFVFSGRLDVKTRPFGDYFRVHNAKCLVEVFIIGQL